MAFHFFFSNRERFSETRKLFEPVIADFYFWATSRVFPAGSEAARRIRHQSAAWHNNRLTAKKYSFSGTRSKNTTKCAKMSLIRF